MVLQSPSVLIKAALNGARGRHEHDALPLSPAALARDATAVREAGAGAFATSAGIRCPIVQHGFGPNAWPLLEDAISRGYDVRIGLEDTLLMPDGSPAKDNAALVAAAAAMVTAHA